jgi:hypothetical protein
MNVLEEVKKILKKHKEDIFREYKVKEIGIFGSFVRDEQKKRSDIDIIVEFNEKDIPDLLTFIEMERYLKRLLKRKVDLVRKEGIRPELKTTILKEVIYL